MTITTSNIATVVKPLGMVKRNYPYVNGKIYDVDSLTYGSNKKNRKSYNDTGMVYVDFNKMFNEAYTEPVGDPKDNLWRIPKLGKVGVWRTVRGRRRFFPLDGSGPRPRIPGVKYKKKKKGLLAKIAGLLGKKVTKKEVRATDKKASYVDLLKNTDRMIAKAKTSKRGKKMLKNLKAMRSALEKGNEKAFKNAELALAKKIRKIKKTKNKK